MGCPPVRTDEQEEPPPHRAPPHRGLRLRRGPQRRPRPRARCARAAGGDIETLRKALWAERPAYDSGACTAAEYWGAVAAAVGIQQLSETEVSEVQEADNRYFLRLDPAARALIHDLARNEVPMVLLSNASQAFGEAVRRADWFEAFGFALISAEEELVKPDRRIYEILLEALSHETGGERLQQDL